MKPNRKPHTKLKRQKVLAAYRDLIDEDDQAIRRLESTGRRGTPRISDVQFAASHGISRATLYRWLGIARRKSVPGPPNLTDINSSIEVLQSDAEDWKFIVSAMNFSAWFVFPLSYFQRCSRTLALVASHKRFEGDLQTMDRFPIEIRLEIQRFITAGLLRRLSDLNDPPIAEHEYSPFFETEYTERDVLRSVGFKFMEAHQKGDAISINKVTAMLEHGRLLKGLILRPALFASLWKAYASTIPFVCAERTVGIDWHLEFDENSGERLEALLRNRQQVREFFGVARNYVNLFRESLDRRAWQRIVMPDW